MRLQVFYIRNDGDVQLPKRVNPYNAEKLNRSIQYGSGMFAGPSDLRVADR